ncbi:MAG: CocE/NonD family hydrolase [Clostridiales bacterium]|nr:CocE/NonD family hydrolase [Clostridiales bacterium]
MEDFFAKIVKAIEEDYEKLEWDILYPEVLSKEIMLPMSDGVGLKTYILYGKGVPEGSSLPVILQRSPYAHAMDMYLMHGRNLAQRGFIYVLQFCRGTEQSEGQWEPNVNERQDGLDTLNWLQNEPWVKNIGYWGNSYLALTGWCLADAVTSKVKGMYLGVYGTDRFTSAYSKGLFRHDVLTSWAMENAGFPVESDYLESCRFMPHYEVDECLWGQKIPWYRQWITATREADEYWQQGFWKMLKDIPSKVKIPLLITDAWYDHHLGSAIKSYETLGAEALENTTLVVGCWNHYSENCIEWDEPKNLQNSEVSAMAEWFRMLLMEEQTPERKVRTYIVGADEWKEYTAWPMPTKGYKTLYLNADANTDFEEAFLLSESPEASSSAEFIYDPQNPVPSLGGESMLHSINKVGSMYQPEPGFREDVLSFISGPVEEAFTIAEKMRVHLQVSTDCDDTAFTAKIMEVRKDGTSVNIRSSITTIAADNSGEAHVPGSIMEVCVDMWDIAWKVQKGSRIRVDISSSDFPQYSIHSNYAGVWSKQEKTRVAHQTVYCGGEYASYLEIPLLDE